MMPDLRRGRSNVVGREPSAEVWTIESQSAGHDLEEGGHDDAGIRHAINPLALR